MVEQVMQVQHRGRRAECRHDPLRHDAVQPCDVEARRAHEPSHARPPGHRARERAASERSDRQLVHAQALLAPGAADPTLRRDRELELDAFGSERRAEPQQRMLGAAGLGRLCDCEYA